MIIAIKIAVKYENFIRLVLSEMWGKDKRSQKCKQSILQYIETIENIVNSNGTCMANLIIE